jgi:transcriptional regulator with XRE-family HTH domain
MSVSDGPRSFDTRLERLLFEEFRSQAALARALGMDRRRMHLVVHGIRPTEDEAKAIAEALGREISELWPESEVAA